MLRLRRLINGGPDQQAGSGDAAPRSPRQTQRETQVVDGRPHDVSGSIIYLPTALRRLVRTRREILRRQTWLRQLNPTSLHLAFVWQLHAYRQDLWS